VSEFLGGILADDSENNDNDNATQKFSAIMTLSCFESFEGIAYFH
jgi:hypothetical protein